VVATPPVQAPAVLSFVGRCREVWQSIALSDSLTVPL
jgi:hypothetical protein